MSRFIIPESLMVEGIAQVDMRTVAMHNSHELGIPEGKDYDLRNWAFKWCEEGERAKEAQQSQTLIPGYVIQGWTVVKYTDGEDKGEVVKKILKSGKVLVLMRRPRVLQKAVDAIYGNISKHRTQDEQEGKTVTGANGERIDRRGMLTNEQLERDAAYQTPIYGANGLTFNNTQPASESTPFGSEALELTSKGRKKK